MNPLIAVRHLSKCYPIYRRPSDKFLEIITRCKFRKDEFWALRSVSLEVPKAASVGVIGQNGSGKSTLLQILAGTMQQTSGEVQVNGKVSALLELGAGFNPEFTGRDNVYMNGAIMGLSQRQMDARFDEIIHFAEIGPFLDQPVKTYSSGMFMRLAFAVAIHVDPEILLVDEALAVGDLLFQQRCLHRIHRLRREGVTILLVTHDLSAVTRFCTRCILLDQGRVIEDDRPDIVVQRYRALIFERQRQQGEQDGETSADTEGVVEDENLTPITTLPYLDHRFGDHRAEVRGVDLFDQLGRPCRDLFTGESARVRITVDYKTELARPIIGFTLRDRLGVEISATNTLHEKYSLPTGLPGQRCTVEFRLELPHLSPGVYTISPAVASGSLLKHEMCDWVDNALHFTIQSSDMVYGLFRMPAAIRCRIDPPGNKG